MNELSRTGETFSLIPRTVDEAMRFSALLSKSEIVPKDFIGKEANIFVAIQWGMELGLQPMQAMQSIAVINGRPSLWGDAVIALVRSSGLCEYVYEEIDAEKAICRTKRVGDAQEVTRTFTVDDAKKAGLWGKDGPWQKYPKRMLQMRARSWCLRDVYPDVMRGVSVAEESQDNPREVDVTPARPQVEQPTTSTPAAAVVDAQVVEPTSGTVVVTKPNELGDAALKAVQAGQVDAAANQEKPAAGETKPLQEGQLRIIRAKLKHAALTETDLLSKFGNLEDLRFDQFDEIQEWISKRGAAVAG